MKTHTTNYINTFIEVAEDCPTKTSQIPPDKKEITLATLQYRMIAENPYKYTSDEIIFNCYALKNNILEDEIQEEKLKFFSKGQPCFRSSPLSKRYGFGTHHNDEGKIAIIPIESKNYQKYLEDSSLKKVKAMRSKKG